MLYVDPAKVAAGDVLKAIRDAEAHLKKAKVDPREYPSNVDYQGVAEEIKEAVEFLIFAHQLCRMQDRRVNEIVCYQIER